MSWRQSIHERSHIGLENPTVCLEVRPSIVCLSVCIRVSLCLSGRWLMQIDATLSSHNDVTWRQTTSHDVISQRLIFTVIDWRSPLSHPCWALAPSATRYTRLVPYSRRQILKILPLNKNVNFSLWNYLNLNSVVACSNKRCTILRNKNLSCKWNCTKIKYTATHYTPPWTHHMMLHGCGAKLVVCLVRVAHDISE